MIHPNKLFVITGFYSLPRSIGLAQISTDIDSYTVFSASICFSPIVVKIDDEFENENMPSENDFLSENQVLSNKNISEKVSSKSWWKWW